MPMITSPHNDTAQGDPQARGPRRWRDKLARVRRRGRGPARRGRRGRLGAASSATSPPAAASTARRSSRSCSPTRLRARARARARWRSTTQRWAPAPAGRCACRCGASTTPATSARCCARRSAFGAGQRRARARARADPFGPKAVRARWARCSPCRVARVRGVDRAARPPRSRWSRARGRAAAPEPDARDVDAAGRRRARGLPEDVHRRVRRGRPHPDRTPSR